MIESHFTKGKRQDCHNAFLQPCNDLATTLCFETMARLLQGFDWVASTPQNIT